MLQYKIPQNVELEDKIVGPLTMKQLVICGTGGGLGYVLYLTLAKTYFMEVWLPPIAIIGLITLAIAFLEIRGIKFVKWILLMIEAMINPNHRVWDKSESTMFIFAVPTAKLQAKEDEDAQKEKAAEANNLLKKQAGLPQLDELTKALNVSEVFDQHAKGSTAETTDPLRSEHLLARGQGGSNINVGQDTAAQPPVMARSMST